MKLNGCLACEYCHGKGEGTCIQKDDMAKVMPAYREADMIVYASPIYYFNMTAQLFAAIQRVYAIGKPAKAARAALLLSSASPNPYEGAIATYKGMLAYTGIEDAGIITAAGEENGSEAKLAEIKAFAKLADKYAEHAEEERGWVTKCIDRLLDLGCDVKLEAKKEGPVCKNPVDWIKYDLEVSKAGLAWLAEITEAAREDYTTF